MSIYSIDPLLPILGEKFHYTAVGSVPREVDGIIDRDGMQSVTVRGADIPVHNYPMVILVKKTDVPVVSPGSDTVRTVDLTGKTVSIRIKKILSNDPKTWVLGAA